MDCYLEFSDMWKNPTPRKELQLQGPRPAALKVCKGSCKVKKPAMGAARGAGPSHAAEHNPRPIPGVQQQQPPAPVIIYLASPKVIHTDPSNFMELVQRLTGASPTTSSAASAEAPPPLAASSSGRRPTQSAPGELSSISQLALADEALGAVVSDSVDTSADLLGIRGAAAGERADNSSAGSLAPLPTSYSSFPPVTVDPASLAFLDDISPVFLHEGNWSSLEGPGNVCNTTQCWNPLSQLYW